jgi:hypothetical protein
MHGSGPKNACSGHKTGSGAKKRAWCGRKKGVVAKNKLRRENKK